MLLIKKKTFVLCFYISSRERARGGRADLRINVITAQ